MTKRSTILLFGFIRKGKGYEYVIRALNDVVTTHPAVRKKIRLLIVGVPSSPMEQLYVNYLKRLIRKLNLEDEVSLVEKYSSRQEIALLFGTADLTVISYTRRVGPSGVFSLALAYEVPSIITCDSKYVTLGMDLPAILVNLDTKEIASAILRLVTDENERQRVVKRMKQYKELNDNQKIARAHVELYEKLCSNKKQE
jgi:glycosyltransferase involved in cell wall biosynthesis